MPSYARAALLLSLLLSLLFSLLFAAADAAAMDYYGAAREDYLSAGEAYAEGDETAFISRLEGMMRKYEATEWAHEAALTLSLYCSQTMHRRDAARRMLRNVVLDAKDLPFSRAAQYLLAGMAEEEGAFQQAAREYRILANMPSLVEDLERIDRYRSTMQRLPSFSIDTACANALRWRASERLLYVDFLQPGAGKPFPPVVKTVTRGEMLAIDLPAGGEKSGSASFYVYVPGDGAASLRVEATLRGRSPQGAFRIEAQPLHPVGVGFHLPAAALLDTTKKDTGVQLDFEKPYRVYGLSLSWWDVSPRAFRVQPLQTTPAAPQTKLASLWRGLFRGGTISPVSRGVASLRLRYDPLTKRFLMLVAAPAARALDPTASSNLYILASGDGANWGVPQRIEVCGFRDDLWPDYAPDKPARLVWVSSRRGPGLYDLFVAKGGGPTRFEKMGCVPFQPEQLAGMPGWVQVRVRCVTLLYADGKWHAFLLARGVGRGVGRGTKLKLKAGSIYQVTLGVNLPRQVPAVIAATTGYLDRYLGRRAPGREPAFISEEAGICALVDTRGRPAVTWLTDSGAACVSVRDTGGKWQTARIWLEPRMKGVELGLVRSLSAVNFRGRLHAVASIEGEGVVLFSGVNWNALMRERVLFENPVLRFHTGLAASHDPGGKVVAAFSPMGPYATAVGVEVVAP